MTVSSHRVHRAARLATLEEISAGGVVVDVRDHQAYLALIARHNRAGRVEWCLPKGHIEAGETLVQTAEREVEEELALTLPAGRLVLADWLPPWSGWDDAVCLVFDGGTHDASLADSIRKQAREIRQATWCTPAEVHHLCADFTARRIDSALAALAAGEGPVYTESGRPV